MKHSIFLLVFVLLLLSVCESKAQVTGRVIDADRQALQHVHVVVSPTGWGTQTDADGRFRIYARPGNVLHFSHVAMEPDYVRVQTRSDEIYIKMQPAEIELAGVEIRAKKKKAHKSQRELLAEYPENKSLIKTSWGILDKDLSSTHFRIIDGEDLVPAGSDFLYSLQVYVPNMQIIRGIGGDSVYLGITSGQPAIFDVDGFIYFSVPLHVNAVDIYRVAILERNAAFMRYGPQGAGGVIVINTKAQTEIDDRGVIRTYDNRAMTDSLKRAASFLDPYQSAEPGYIEKLRAVKTRKKAWSVYEEHKEEYLQDPYYFLDVYDLFLSRWGNSKTSTLLFEDVREHLPEDVSVLRALAYLQQHYNKNSAASDQYIQILLTQSWEAQALRDAANAYAEAGDIEKAWLYYTQYIGIQNQLPESFFDALGEDFLITTEMLGILDRHDAPFLDPYEMEDILVEDMRTRLVFEWNQGDAEFELQFVSPQKFFDTWDHNASGDDSQAAEVAKGYCSKQFFLAKENVGLWEVNIDYKGNPSGMPTYLKVSIYHNFGLTDQSLEVKVFKLTEDQEKGQLLTIQQG